MNHNRSDNSMDWVPCALCGGSITKTHVKLQRLAMCVDCGLLYVNPRPSFDRVISQYNQNYFLCNRPVNGGYENYLADKNDIESTFDRRLAYLAKKLPISFSDQKTVLDVGCASGFFLNSAKKIGWQAEGLETCSEMAREAVKQGHSVTITNLENAKLEAGKYDMVTLWDVIEHLADPLEAVTKIRGLLKPAGLLTITTPDAGSILARVLRSNWLGFRSLDEHLYFFTRQTITALLIKSGYQVLDISYTGKYLSISRITARLRYYTRIGAKLLKFTEGKYFPTSVYLNPLDTIMVVAKKTAK